MVNQIVIKQWVEWSAFCNLIITICFEFSMNAIVRTFLALKVTFSSRAMKIKENNIKICHTIHRTRTISYAIKTKHMQSNKPEHLQQEPEHASLYNKVILQVVLPFVIGDNLNSIFKYFQSNSEWNKIYIRILFECKKWASDCTTMIANRIYNSQIVVNTFNEFAQLAALGYLNWIFIITPHHIYPLLYANGRNMFIHMCVCVYLSSSYKHWKVTFFPWVFTKKKSLKKNKLFYHLCLPMRFTILAICQTPFAVSSNLLILTDIEKVRNCCLPLMFKSQSKCVQIRCERTHTHTWMHIHWMNAQEVHFMLITISAVFFLYLIDGSYDVEKK